MLKKLIKRKLSLFFIFFFTNLLGLAIRAETQILENSFLDSENQNIFTYQDEASYGVLKKQKIFVHWPILNKKNLYEKLLKEQEEQKSLKPTL